MNDFEIIQLLGGITAVARLLSIKPPSVHAWIEGGIPDGRLRELAAQIEIKSGGRFSRREHWPDNYDFYWPELAVAPAITAQAAIDSVVQGA
ncbi:MAG TPA: Cro/Cl family transcriptional regulator [Rhodoferax sp.]